MVSALTLGRGLLTPARGASLLCAGLVVVFAWIWGATWFDRRGATVRAAFAWIIVDGLRLVTVLLVLWGLGRWGPHLAPLGELVLNALTAVGTTYATLALFSGKRRWMHW